jgi:hypothetical protein
MRTGPKGSADKSPLPFRPLRRAPRGFGSLSGFSRRIPPGNPDPTAGRSGLAVDELGGHLPERSRTDLAMLLVVLICVSAVGPGHTSPLRRRRK